MAEAKKQPDFLLVELNPEVRVKTPLPPSCHSALRAGFAGYSTNPRWNNAKLQAWKLGREWRRALAVGEMQVYGPDLVLMTTAEKLNYQRELEVTAPAQDSTESEPGGLRNILGWSRKKLAAG